MYEKKPVGWKKHLDFVLLDFLFMHISLLIAYFIRFGMGFCSQMRSYVSTAMLISISFFVVVLWFEGYKNIMKRGVYAEFKSIVKQTALVALVTVLMLYLTQNAAVTSRLAILLTFAVDFVFSFVIRQILKTHLKKKAENNTGDRSLIVICLEHHAEKFVERVKNTTYELNVTGVIIADKDMT